jgi:hypothetical protein
MVARSPEAIERRKRYDRERRRKARRGKGFDKEAFLERRARGGLRDVPIA